jgi:toxin ParE1/3/4
MQIVWTAAALRDLAAIREFIAADNPLAADRQVQLILAGVATLLQFPQIGRPGRVVGTNELVIARTPYLVPYRLRGDAIEIARVLHARQRWPDQL